MADGSNLDPRQRNKRGGPGNPSPEIDVQGDGPDRSAGDQDVGQDGIDRKGRVDPERERTLPLSDDPSQIPSPS